MPPVQKKLEGAAPLCKKKPTTALLPLRSRCLLSDTIQPVMDYFVKRALPGLYLLPLHLIFQVDIWRANTSLSFSLELIGEHLATSRSLRDYHF